MILRKLEIENFRCYSKKTEFNFAPPDENAYRNIYLIGGRNGAGKTSFLGAIHLCLYGRFESRDGSIKVQQPADMIDYVNGAYKYKDDRDGLARHIRERDNNDIRLAVTYEDENDEITIERIWKPRRIRRSDNSILPNLEETLSIYENGTKLMDWNSEEIKQWVELSIIPWETAQFFFFDGEKVEHFAAPERSSKDIPQAIERLLGIQLYVNLKDHLQKYIVTEIRSESIEKLDGEIMSARGQLKKTEGEKEELAIDIENTKSELDRIQKEKNDLENQYNELFLRYGGPKSQRLEIERIKRREQLQAKRNQIEKELKSHLTDTYPYQLLYKELKRVLTQSDNLSQKDAAILARKYFEKLSSRLEEYHKQSGTCYLCNVKSQFPEPKVISQRISNYLNEIISEEFPEIEDGLSSPLSISTARSISNTIQKIEANSLSYAGLFNQKIALDQEIELIDNEIEELKLSPEAKRNQDILIVKIRNNGAEFQANSDKLDHLTREKEKKIEDINKLHEELDRLEDIKGQKSVEQKILSLARTSIKVLNSYVDMLRKERLKSLEDETTKIFKLLLSSAVYDDREGKIAFDPETYFPTIYLQGSPIVAQRLSRGIKQLYALALLGGLCKSAPSSIPLVIDTPLSGLDDKNRQCVLTKFFPRAARQVILLSQPDEIGSQNIDTLEKHIIQKCLLEFDASLHSTYVRENQYF